MELDHCINFILTKTQNKVFQYFKNQLSQFDVTPVQYAILKCLWDSDGQTPTQIAQKICLDGSTITGLLDRMQNKGLLQRMNNPEDRRGIIIELKEPGQRLQAEINEAILAANNTVLSSLDDHEQILLKEYLIKIGDSL